MIDRVNLHAYVDGEVSPEQASVLEGEFRSSPELVREVQAIRDLKSMLATRATVFDGAIAWKSCISRLNEVDKTKRTERIVGRYAPALCGFMFLAIVVAGQFGRSVDRHVLSTPDLARISFSPIQKPKNLDFDVLSWQERLLKQSHLSTPDMFSIRGVSRGEINGVPITSFAIRDEDGDLRIVAVQEPLVLEGVQQMDDHQDLKAGMFNGVNCVIKTQDDTTIFVVAERTYEDLAKVAAKLKIR